MQRRKNGPALFELLNEGDGDITATIKMPKSWRADPPKPRADSRQRSLRLAPQESGGREPGAAVAKSTSTSFFEVDGERIRLSFTSLSAAGVIFAALIVVLGAYELGTRAGRDAGLKAGYEAGRASYAADAERTIDSARAFPSETPGVERLLEAPAATVLMAADSESSEQPEPASSPWIRGYTYTVAQEFTSGHLEDAQRAQEYLANHGIATELIRTAGEAGQLITLQGFNHADATQKQLAEQFLKKVRAVGAQYFAEGGGYKLEGYFKTLKNASW